MSRTQRQPRKTSDFSIERILSADNRVKTRDFALVDNAMIFGKDEESLSRTGSRDEFSDKFSRLVPDYVCHSSSAGFDDDCRGGRISGLNRFSERSSVVRDNRDLKTVDVERREFSWLQCTRYRPPKLPRKSVTGQSCKRRPGAHPRIPFTAAQLQILEDKYRGTPYLSRRDVIHLSTLLRLPQSRVKIWFQNRRARDRRESTVAGSDTRILSNDASPTDKSKDVPGVQPITQSPI